MWLAGVSLVCVPAMAMAAVPWATTVVSYDYDGDGDTTNDPSWYANPQVVLGSPSRMTGVSAGYPGVVSLFNGPWGPDEIVSIAPGGQLVVSFDEPIRNDASHLYGVDLIVFGHAMFSDPDYSGTRLPANPSLLRSEPGLIEVSGDGLNWHLVPNVFADMLYPTLGYLDSGAYDWTPGSVLSDFLKPVNPALQLSDFANLTYAQAVALYEGSGGGTPVDIGATGLDEALYVRITVPEGAGYAVEVDALAVVPEPMSLALLACGAVVRRMRSGGKKP